MEGQVTGCHSVEQWTDYFNKAKVSGKLAVVEFTASWNGHGRVIAPIVAEIARKMPHVIFLKVDADELRTLVEEFQVNGMPTFVFLKQGYEVDRIVGPTKDDLHNCILKHAVA